MEKCKIRCLQALAALAVVLGAFAGKAETGSKTRGGGWGASSTSPAPTGR